MFSYDRVTEVLGKFTGIEQIDPEVLQRSADRGTAIHNCIEEALTARFSDDPVSDEVLAYMESYEAFWDKSRHVFKDCEMIVEKRLFCDELMITGKIDVIFTKPGRTFLIDWKTGSRKQDSWFIQGAAYRHLLKVNGYDNPDDVLFVHLKKNKKPTTYKDSEHEKHLDIFKKCLELYRHFNMQTRKKP